MRSSPINAGNVIYKHMTGTAFCCGDAEHVLNMCCINICFVPLMDSFFPLLLLGIISNHREKLFHSVIYVDNLCVRLNHWQILLQSHLVDRVFVFLGG